MNETPFPGESPLDIQHDTDPAREQPPARRIPHLGHALLYFSLNIFCIAICQLVALFLVHGTSAEGIQQHKFAIAVGQISAYVLVFAISTLLFPFIWGRSFADGIGLNLRGLRLNGWKLLLVGLVTAAIAQVVIRLFPMPDRDDLMGLFTSTRAAWAVVALVSVLPPIAEEVAFRGFLLPALATAYDWLTLERCPAGVARWTQTVEHTQPAWTFAVFFSSIAFAALHAPEYGYSAGSLAVLFVASVVFSVVRIRTRSVAAAAWVHIVYNAVPLTCLIVATGGLRHLEKLQ